MSDVARGHAGQSNCKPTSFTHKKASMETHAPYEAEAEATQLHDGQAPPPPSTSSAVAGSRRPETITIVPFSEPTTAGEPAMTSYEHRPRDYTTVTQASQSSGGNNNTLNNNMSGAAPGGVTSATSLSSMPRAHPSPPSGARAPAEGPSVGSAGGPGRYADPTNSSLSISPSMGVAATRHDFAKSVLKAGASLSGGNAAQMDNASLPSASSPLMPNSGGTKTTTTATTVPSTAGATKGQIAMHSGHTDTSTNNSNSFSTAVTTSSSNKVHAPFVSSNEAGSASGDLSPVPPASSSSATAAAAAAGTAAVDFPSSHNRLNFNTNSGGGAVPPPLQSAASVPATTITSGGAGSSGVPSCSLPPMPPPVPGQLPSTKAQNSNTDYDSNHDGSSNVAARDKGERAADPYGRPAVALSANLLELYKMVNAQYCAKRRVESPGPKYNNGYDDKDGHYIFLPGEVIFQRYIAQEVLGKGSFGTVIRGFDQKRSEAVAMKITRRGSSFRSQAKLELDILLRLNENPALNHLVVRLLKVFEWQGHLVLVFELLSFNLYQLIKCTRFNGVSLDLVRKFAYQLTHTLLQLESQKPHSIIHCDLKPENILLRNQNRSGIRLIDFGSACYTAKRFHRYIQSRFYRSPEVILFLEYGTAIDRWSLACVLVELHTGVPLFDGRTEAAQLAKFECTLGPVPAEMIAASPKASRFYYGSLAAGFQLKEPVPERRSLESVIGVTTGGPRGRRLDTPGHDEKSYREFHDFIARFLRYQPEERMSCRDALQHPFLASLYTSDLMQQQERGVQQRQQSAPPQQQSSTASASPAATHAGASSSVSHGAAKAGGSGNAVAASSFTAEEKSGDGGGGLDKAHA